MTKELDLTKPVQTREGESVRILCTDADTNTKGKCLLGLYRSKQLNKEYAYIWYEDGRAFSNSPSSLDLVNVPVKKECWVRVYKDRFGDYYPSMTVFPTKEAADKSSIGEHTAKVEWEE